MVYWGCGTARNRCVWTVGAAVSLTGIVLLCAGAGRMWVCNHTPSGEWLPQELVTCRVQAGILIALCPLVVILGVLPSLLFFQSCYAIRPPAPVDWEKVSRAAWRVEFIEKVLMPQSRNAAECCLCTTCGPRAIEFVPQHRACWPQAA